MPISQTYYSTADVASKGFFTTYSSLITAHPTGQDGWSAILGDTDTIWVWDSGTSSWIDTGTGGGGGGTGTTWSVITTSQSASSGDYGYFANGAGLIIVTLPITSSVGNAIQVSANNVNGWKIAQNSGQNILAGNSQSTLGTGGYLASTAIGDTVELICVVANTTWRAVDMQGIITIV